MARSTGMQVVRREGKLRLIPNPHRELSAPAFIFSSVRSGSTLLRMILDSHTDVYAPHELHLAHVRVKLEIPAAQKAMDALGFNERELQNMVWDRLLTRALQNSGKKILVEKTPNLVFQWSRVGQAFPDAKFIYLLRHPAAILDSWQRARTAQTEEEAIASVTKYLTALREARTNLPGGHTVRYEDLTRDPAAEAKKICNYLGVDFQPAMVDYGNADHGPLVAGLGDWQEKIQTGAVQQARPVPTIDLPDKLKVLAADLGY
ncbi:sulfotransferase [Winogradskya consettensis]|uniref:Sulfotransferase family protein n=1 Tax=Winogradskya consettensis TaxID=113560 RepID=A0A919S7R9_9ACTN|nr:sulfotransferase [Actinoplanes consettensis]GIM67024.1 sulfotransferase family protein [Actinoplanes consettensis]